MVEENMPVTSSKYIGIHNYLDIRVVLIYIYIYIYISKYVSIIRGVARIPANIQDGKLGNKI